jgi:LmbE family N-acetylglucosaminyl deacetylase
MNFSRVLIIAPHTDDAELGCGASVARFLAQSKRVHIAVFSTANDSVPVDLQTASLKEEFIESMKLLGLQEDEWCVYDYPVRLLSAHRQEVLDRLLVLRRELNPELVLIPSGRDLHQDHQVLYWEGLRAFKDISVWGYELPWNHVTFSANAFVTFERSHLMQKWNALQCYKSQLCLERPYFSLQFIEGLARVRGVQVKAQYAEAFEVIRIRV